MVCQKQTYSTRFLFRNLVHIPSVRRWARTDLTISCNTPLYNLRAVAAVLCGTLHRVLAAFQEISIRVAPQNRVDLVASLELAQTRCAIHGIITIGTPHLTITYGIIRPGRAETTRLRIRVHLPLH